MKILSTKTLPVTVEFYVRTEKGINTGRLSIVNEGKKNQLSVYYKDKYTINFTYFIKSTLQFWFIFFLYGIKLKLIFLHPNPNL